MSRSSAATRRSWRRPGPLRLGAVAGVLLASAWAGAELLPMIQLPGVSAPRVLRMPAFKRPGGDAFFVYSAADELSHEVLYHDLGSSIDHARAADILFVGNSRLPLGLREEFIVPAAARAGVSVFSLACGHAEKVRFALDLIRRHDLRPKVVVVSGGPHIFLDGVSPHAEQVMTLTRWQAAKDWLESSAAWAVQSRLHRGLPKLDFYHHNLTSPWIIYRSPTTGWWRPAREPAGHYPIGFADEWPSYERTLPLARELQRELADRGALMVLTLVPYGDTRVGHLAFLADQLGVAAIMPPTDEVFTADGSHLDRASARRVSEEFWRRFTALPAVRQRLGLATTPPSDAP